MLQSILDSTSIPFLEKKAIFGERRQEVLAGNIANIDTPDYRMRDLPVARFQEALKQAIENRKPHDVDSVQAAFGTRQAEAAAEPFPADLFAAIEPPQQDIMFQDGNNRSVEHANMEMLKNTMQQTFAVELMHAQLAMLQTVISERA
jgi:flagellar basal-body rod protein FlgB